jgi:flavorubredoxin
VSGASTGGQPRGATVAVMVPATGTATLLIVHHTVSPRTQRMLDAVVSGARDDEIEGVRVEVKPALQAGVADVLAASGFVLGTPANIGYMSGALKHFFDQVYYPCREQRAGSPYGVFVHGNLDLTGCLRALRTCTTGMRWEQAYDDVTVLGEPTPEDLTRCWELGATLAARLMPG